MKPVVFAVELTNDVPVLATLECSGGVPGDGETVGTPVGLALTLTFDGTKDLV